MTKSRAVAVLAAVLVSGCSSRSTTENRGEAAASSSVETSPSAAPSSAVALASSSDAQGTLESGSTVGAKLTVGADPLFADDGAIVEANEDGSSAFVVDPEGRVTAALADAEGKPTTNRSLKLSFVKEGAEAPSEVLLIPDADKRYFVGHGPALDAEITPVTYEISGGAKPIVGVLHIPKGGTKGLVASSTVVAAAHVTPIVGPHGGRIERVGDDDVELLIDPDSGEARAWILVDGKVVPPKEREVGLYLDGRYVDCYPDQNDSFYVKLDAHFELRALHKVSVALYTTEHVHTVVWGFRPHVAVYLARPVVDVRVVGWTTKEKVKWDKNPNEPGLGWAKGKEKHKGGASAGAGVSVSVGVGVGASGHGGGKGGESKGGGGGKGGGKGRGKH